MSDKDPLLTVENVRYWYWEHDPPLSGHDIAREVGCYFQKVYKFMNDHNVPIRNYSEAGKLMFQDPKKVKTFRKIRTSPEYLKKQSKSHKQLWANNQELRVQRSALMKEVYRTVLTDSQKVILFLMQNKRGKFIKELVVLTSLDKPTLYKIMGHLRDRGLISSIKRYDYETSSRTKFSKYYITQKGLEVLEYNLKNEPFDFKELANIIKNQKITRPNLVESNKKFLGETQKILLKKLSTGKEFFTEELFQLTHLKKIGASLYKLFKRGYVGRRKDINAQSTNRNKRAYKYYITEKGANLFTT